MTAKATMTIVQPERPQVVTLNYDPGDGEARPVTLHYRPDHHTSQLEREIAALQEVPTATVGDS